MRWLALVGAVAACWSAAPACAHTTRWRSAAYRGFDVPIAGIAADRHLVFVGEPLTHAVAVLRRSTGREIATLPPPPGGFRLPFILHRIRPGQVAVLDAGGLPHPSPFVASHPVVYVYRYGSGIDARLTRTIDFGSVPVGFPEDFLALPDGRYLLSDAILGTIWVADRGGTVAMGIGPRSFAARARIPALALCPTMPRITVNGYPFLFTGSTVPGVSPLAARDGTVYFASPCARGIYAFPLSVLSDARAPYARARSIRLIAPTPTHAEVEELLGLAFDPRASADPDLYAADPLALSVLRIDPFTGTRRVIAHDPRLLDFPSSLAFLPPRGHEARLLVVSNQQERTPLTNDAVSVTTFSPPFLVTSITSRR